VQNLKALQQRHKDKAKKYDRRAEESSRKALREFYRGRAAEARAAASSLSKFIFDPEQDTYQLDE
jgi:hypothetical protein